MDPREFLPREQHSLIIAERTCRLPHLTAGQIEIQVLPVDLDKGQLRKRDADQRAAGFQRQTVLRSLLTLPELIQNGVQRLCADGLQRYSIALTP